MEAAGTLEWLITAFILAFVFRAFAVEAFRIPTGSMADTLMGAHYQLRCLQCGYRYNLGYLEQQDLLMRSPFRPEPQSRCPSCGYRNPLDESTPVSSGDRILVLKCIYQFQDPKRWDVVVFKNPTKPEENYIKRLVGLPGEKVEIIDGDVYINGQIVRKPPEVQKELWMPVHDFDYQPVNPNQLGAFNGYPWKPPFNFGSAWKISSDNPTQIVLDSPAGQVTTLTYGAPSANDFQVTYAYNDLFPRVARPPQCSDLMARFYATPGSTDGRIGIALSKYGVDYKAWWDPSGRLVIARVADGKETTLAETAKGRNGETANSPILMKFAVVDHELLFECGGRELKVDLGRGPEALTYSDAKPRVEFFGSGKWTLSHVALFRDTYYTSSDPSARTPLRATAEGGGPFQIGPDEFFMLGDNSPLSLDSRYWSRPSVTTKGTEAPRAGVVPRYYLVGKAIFVYWPSGFSPFGQTLSRSIPGAGIRWVPNVGRMRFIYGGMPASNGG